MIHEDQNQSLCLCLCLSLSSPWGGSTYVFVWMCTHMTAGPSVRTCMWMPELGTKCLPRSTSILQLRQSPSLSLELITSARLVSQGTSGIYLPVSTSPVLGYKHRPPPLAAYVSGGRPKLSFSCFQGKLFPNWVISPASHFVFFKKLNCQRSSKDCIG